MSLIENSPAIPAASILSATIIGAGMFSLPFIFRTSGWLIGAVYLGVFSLAFTLIHLMYADIIKDDPEPKFILKAKRYLGGWAFWPTVAATVGGMLFTLTIYLILTLSFVKLLFVNGDFLSQTGNYENGVVLAFWFLGSVFVFLNAKEIALSETLVTGAMATIVAIIFAFGLLELKAGSLLNSLAASALPQNINLPSLFMPFGPILFAFAGRAAVPSVMEYLKKLGAPQVAAKKAIIWGTLLPAFVYVMFIVGISLLSPVISPDGVSGMAQTPFFIKILVGALGILALWSTYITLGINIKEILKFDLGASPIIADLAVILLPLLLYLAGLKNFFFLVGIVGGVFIAFESIIIILAWRKKAMSEPRRTLFARPAANLSWALVSILALGAIYEIFYGA